MFLVNGLPLLNDDLSILTELRRQLAELGINRFADFKVGASNIQTNCPIHSDGQEKKPSCGIRTTDSKNAKSGMVHCFSCGYTATLEQMISNCFGVNDLGQFGTKWLVQNFVTISVENRPEIKLDFSRNKENIKNEYVSEKELEKYRFTHSYMYKRKITDEVIEKFDVGYDACFEIKNNLGKTSRYECVTFPVRDKKGKTLFIARRSVRGKFFHYPESIEKPVYGLYEIDSDSAEIIVCESIFNVLTCYTYKRKAVALLGLGTEYQYKQLLDMPNRTFILAFDGDAAGERAVERIRNRIGGKKILKRVFMPKGKDINDLSIEEFEDVFKKQEII